MDTSAFVKLIPSTFELSFNNLLMWFNMFGIYILISFPFIIGVGSLRFEESLFIYFSLMVVLISIPRFVVSWHGNSWFSIRVITCIYFSVLFLYDYIFIYFELAVVLNSLFHIFLLVNTIYVFLFLGIIDQSIYNKSNVLNDAVHNNVNE